MRQTWIKSNVLVEAEHHYLKSVFFRVGAVTLGPIQPRASPQSIDSMWYDSKESAGFSDGVLGLLWHLSVDLSTLGEALSSTKLPLEPSATWLSPSKENLPL
jgi:hypothetical protein